MTSIIILVSSIVIEETSSASSELVCFKGEFEWVNCQQTRVDSVAFGCFVFVVLN